MVVRGRRKARKLRGRTRSMGWGRIGQHRKSGSRGGKGAAGLGKHKWTWTIKYMRDYFGKRGFTPPRIRLKSSIKSVVNVGDLSEIVSRMAREGKAVREGGRIVVNLEEMGVDKLLGEGRIELPVKVIVRSASKSAVKKIEESGGLVELVSR